MPEFDKHIPETGDTVRVRNTENNSIYAEGEVTEVERYDTEEDNAVYIQFTHEEASGHGDDGFIEYKEGYWQGDEYSWLKKAPPNTTNSTQVDSDCWEYEIL